MAVLPIVIFNFVRNSRVFRDAVLILEPMNVPFMESVSRCFGFEISTDAEHSTESHRLHFEKLY